MIDGQLHIITIFSNKNSPRITNIGNPVLILPDDTDKSSWATVDLCASLQYFYFNFFHSIKKCLFNWLFLCLKLKDAYKVDLEILSRWWSAMTIKYRKETALLLINFDGFLYTDSILIIVS